MPRRVISLSDDHWHFGQVPPCPFATPDVFDIPAVTEWLPATVPGHVRTDLLALGRIPDPFFGEGYKESLWAEQADWWYRRQIRLDKPSPTERIFIIFEGIDYLSAIFINGRETARHEGMFSRQIIEITEAMQAGNGAVEIAVRIWGSHALPPRRLSRLQQLWQTIAAPLHGSWVGIYPNRSATLKCQMSFGWDFAPPIRTMGIWDDVWLVKTGSVFIEAAGATGKPSPPLRGIEGGKREQITLQLTLNSRRARPVEVAVQIVPANFNGPSSKIFYFPLQLPAGSSRHHLHIELSEAALWHPWDRGFPHLYTITVTLTDSGSDALDQITLRTGFRAIELNNWQFTINGQPEFIRGLNWVPADSFPGRLRTADYKRLLTQAKESGANLLRVWGGGLREKQAFYDLCDELGLLVWQEFPFACMFLGSYPRDRTYLKNVEAECRAIVRQTRHHPSIILWCGGNEFSRRRNRPLLNILTSVVQQHDGTRPFIPTSPGPGDAHNWNVWHGDASIQSYQSETAPFLSEFGLQSLPYLDTLTAALPTPANPQTWATHHADLQKLGRYNEHLSIINEQLTINNLEFTIHHSQLMQAAALQTAIEHMRRRKGDAGGVCLWQFNEPWPAISWAVVDYLGRPKLAYQQLKTWYNPILVCLEFPVGQKWQPGDTFTAKIWAINDTLTSITNSQLLITLNNRPIHTKTVILPPDSVQCTGALTHRFTTPPHTLNLILSHEKKILCQNSYNLTWFDESRGGITHCFRRRVADWVMR